MMRAAFATDLFREAGSKPRVHPDECARYSIADRIPSVVFSPRTIAQAAKAVAAVSSEGATVAIRGGGTKQWRPPTPASLDAVVDMQKCAGILEYTPADLTVTLQAGTRYADMQSALHAQGQFFPSDPPFAAEATIGGMLSARSDGALRQCYGSLRDNLLGMRICTADGSVAFTGAHVVKSVAGYDIAKLFTGAFGTLGIIGEVTLKIAPLPKSERAMVALFDTTEAACDAAAQIAASPLFPLATTLHGRSAAKRIRALPGEPAAGWILIVRCGGTVGAVVRQFDGTAAIAKGCGARAIAAIESDSLPHAWSDICELAGGAVYDRTKFVSFKVTALPSQLASVIADAESAFPQAEFTLHPVSGNAYIQLDMQAESLSLTFLQAAFARWIEFGWSVQVLSAPVEYGRALRQPIDPNSPLTLLRRIKSIFDPTGTFDPGRLAGGI